MGGLKPIGNFPNAVQKKFVGVGLTETVYRFEVPQGCVAFIFVVGSNPTPEGATVSWTVDGEAVDLVKEKIRVGSLEKPFKIRPPIVCKRETVWSVQSPIEYEFMVLLDGEIYELPLTYGSFVKMLETTLSQLEGVAVKPAKPSTFIVDHKNVVITDSWEVCDVEGAGSLEELLILTTVSDFNLTVMIDGRRYEGSYSDYATYSTYIDEIVALQSDSNYRIHMENMPFSKSLRIYVRGNLTLTKVFCKMVKEV